MSVHTIERDPKKRRIYRRGVIHPSDIQHIERLTLNQYWGYKQFRDVMVALGTVGRTIPAANRPESIDLSGLGSHMDALKIRGETHLREHSRGVFVDLQKKSFVLGRTTRGEARSTRLDWTPPPSRRQYVRKSLFIHNHFMDRFDPRHMHFSDEDFRILVDDNQLQGAIMIYGDSKMLVLKTSSTPNNMPSRDIQRRMDELQKEFLKGKSSDDITLQELVQLNKHICLEFGLVLYIAKTGRKNLFERVSVVD